MQGHRLGGLGCLVALSIACAPPGSGSPVVEPQGPPAVSDECQSVDPTVLAGCVERERFDADLVRVTGPRPPGSSRWQAVQNLCDTRLTELGFEVERHVYETGVNVVGTRLGTQWPDQYVMVGAHYDHIPGCAGADDNATGVAGALEVARVLSAADHPRSLMVGCWDEEERGLIGSRAWAVRARERELDIAVYFNFDAIGFVDPRPGTQEIPDGFSLIFPAEVARLREREFRADFIAIVADAASEPWAREMAAAAEREGLPHAVLAIPRLVQVSHVAVDLQRSDHAPFWDQGYPAIMITDTADFRSDRYHCYGGRDSIESLDTEFATRVVRATTSAAALALQGPRPVEPSPSPPAK
ncbi:MAG: M28 family peptidase [Myxococcota bacterium]